MNLSDLLSNVTQTLKANGPEILTAVGVTGVVSTAVLAGKASYEAHRIIDWDEKVIPPSEDARERFKTRIKATWHLYVPAVLSGAGTITCIMLASRGHAKRTVAAVTAYSITEKAFSDYREKVVEQIGAGKDQKVRDSVAQDVIRAHPPTGEIIVLGKSDVLCCELHTHRYFRSDMEMLRKAKNDINHWINTQRHASLDDFYSILGLPSTDSSANLGWDEDELMELVFSAVLTEENEPCLAFSYNYLKPLK